MPKKENPLRQLPVNMDDCGKIRIRLKDILEQRNISLNQLSFLTISQRSLPTNSTPPALPSTPNLVPHFPPPPA